MKEGRLMEAAILYRKAGIEATYTRRGNEMQTIDEWVEFPDGSTSR